MENSINHDAAEIFSDAMKKDILPSTRETLQNKKIKKGLKRLDLHHLTVPTALTKLQARLKYARNFGEKTLTVVTGTGRHSPGIGSPLQSEVEFFLSQNDFRYEYKQGVFKICL